MATNNDADKATKQTKTKPPESQYSAAELAKAARERFDVPPEVVLAALKLAEVDKASIPETERIVRAFMKREVK